MQAGLKNDNFCRLLITHSPSPGRFQTPLWPPPWCTSPPRTPSPSVLASSPRKLGSLSCVCSETGSPLEETMKLKRKRRSPPQKRYIYSLIRVRRGSKELWNLCTNYGSAKKTENKRCEISTKHQSDCKALLMTLITLITGHNTHVKTDLRR